MKPAPFDYYAPETLEEAIALLVRFEEEGLEARIIAGGQSLMPMLSLRVARPEVLVDLRRIGGLDHIRDEGATIAIGAMANRCSMPRRSTSDTARSVPRAVSAVPLPTPIRLRNTRQRRLHSICS